MIKNALNSFSTGFFRTLGRMIAFFLIGAIIGFLMMKLGGSI